MNSICITLARFGIPITSLLLVSSLACSKADSPKAESVEDTVAVGAKNVAGLAQETLLVLKFHHDN